MKAYMLVDGEVKECTINQWALWFEGFDNTILKTGLGQYLVSTVFLGLDHNFSETGPPLIFETMVFHPDGSPCEFQERHATKAEAEIYHASAVATIKRLSRNKKSD